jgi:A/G-specific adenine glycosylase
LPWRLTRDPYAVLVSEVMLQQTQVDRVIPYWQAWLERWPTLESLAQATPAEVIQQWAGLGYNRRAVNMLRAAQKVVELHGGQVPADEELLRELPGIGGYTAGAIVSFALERRTIVMDTNIARLVARLCLGEPSHKLPDFRHLFNAASDLLPDDDARHHNLALMDLGALICTAKSPKCMVCPLMQHCRWLIEGTPEPPAGSPAPKFEETARFARGRIVDALRSSPHSQAELEAMLPEQHREPLPRYLTALERDGLIELADDNWQLAGFKAG